MEEGVVDGNATRGRGVENGKFCVFDSSSEEICDGVCASVEGDCVEGSVLRSTSLQVHSIADILISDVFCDFLFILFIDEDEGVMFWISRIVLDPILTWMIGLFLAVGD